VLGLNTISVAPEYQRQGVGSMLLQWGCDKADSYGWNSFVMASPAGVRLYSRFDFKVVGQVQTEHGTFTSMFRESRPSIEKYVGQEKQAGFVGI
jgi:predicted N-acetyltransferase YhbS